MDFAVPNFRLRHLDDVISMITVSDFAFKMMGFALKMMGFAFKMMDYVLQMVGFVLKMMDYVLQMVGFVLNMMNFVLKMMFPTLRSVGGAARSRDKTW